VLEPGCSRGTVASPFPARPHHHNDRQDDRPFCNGRPYHHLLAMGYIYCIIRTTSHKTRHDSALQHAHASLEGSSSTQSPKIHEIATLQFMERTQTCVKPRPTQDVKCHHPPHMYNFTSPFPSNFPIQAYHTLGEYTTRFLGSLEGSSSTQIHETLRRNHTIPGGNTESQTQCESL
jgi:hypothetical protein